MRIEKYVTDDHADWSMMMKDYHYKMIGLAPPADKKRRRWGRVLCLLCGSVASLGIGTCLNSKLLNYNDVVAKAIDETEYNEWFWGGEDG